MSRKLVPAKIYESDRDAGARLIRQALRLDPTHRLKHADIYARGREALYTELSTHQKEKA